MVSIPVGFGLAAAEMTVTGDSESMFTTCGFQVEVPPFDQADADAISDAFADFLRAVMINTYTYVGVDIQIGNDGGNLLFRSTVSTGVGTQGTDGVPQNTAYLFHKLSGQGGRRNRGRMYVPGVSATVIDNVGNLTAGGITAFNTAASTFENAMDTAGFGLAILHSAAPLTPTLFETLTVDARVATQRRRLR